MAARTFTASELNSLRSIHAGVNVCRSRFEDTSANSLTASDVIFLNKIPNHATLYNIQIKGGMNSSTTWKLSAGFSTYAPGSANTGYPVDQITGVSVSANSLASSISLTTSAYAFYGSLQWTIATNPTGLPLRFSFSDDQAPQYVWYQVTNGGSTTGSMSLDSVVWYVVGDA